MTGAVAGPRIEHLLVSPRHRYDGRPADGPRPAVGVETRDRVEVRADHGLVGDRYFGTVYRHAAVTFLAIESLERLAATLKVPAFDPVRARRNVVTRGLDVEGLVDSIFTLRAGAAAIRFLSLTRANPCAWMDHQLAPGAHRAMRGDAGIRCQPLDDGELRVGPLELLEIERLSAEEAHDARRAALRHAAG